MNIFELYDLSIGQWLIVFLCALLIGLTKTGVVGIGMIAIPLMAYVFGGKLSVGIVLPMLITGDFFAVWYFRRFAEWNYLYKILPWTIVGIVLGTYIGNQVNDETFKVIMGVIILLSVAFMAWQDIKGRRAQIDLKGFGLAVGLIAGFSTMVGNLAGPIITLYFLSVQLPKNKFIGTGAWYYLLVNIFKVPFHVFSWGTINASTIVLNIWLIPIIAVGALLGVKIVRYIPELAYRRFLIVVTFISALFLFL